MGAWKHSDCFGSTPCVWSGPNSAGFDECPAPAWGPVFNAYQIPRNLWSIGGFEINVMGPVLSFVS